MSDDDGLPIHLSDDEYAEAARSQRASLREWADQIERGKLPGRRLTWKVLAQIVRHHADGIPDQPKRGRGQPNKVPYGDVAVEFVILHHHQGLSQNRAHELLCERYECNLTTIKRAVKRHGSAARRLLLQDW